MKKMMKMSLVAAVAVAGLTTTSSAAKLADAIQNTDLNGYIRYRYTNGESTTETNNYKVVLVTKSKVNDQVTAKIKVAGAASTTDASGDADPQVDAVKEANFIIKTDAATIIAGKQGLPTPFADSSDQQGTGIVALAPMGSVTLAAGWFTNTDATSNAAANSVATVDIGGNNIAAVAAIGKAADISYALWYAKVDEKDLGINNPTLVGAGIEAGASAINVNLKGAFGPVNVELNYAKVDYTSNNAAIDAQSPSQGRLVVSGKAGAVSYAAGVVVAGKDGADVTLGDSDASANFVMEAFDAAILADTQAYYLALGAPVGPVNLKAEYGFASEIAGSGSADASELKLSAVYAMSKNFKVTAWATSCSDALDGQDTNRLELKYTF